LYLASRVLEKASAGRSRLVKYDFVAQPVPRQPLSADRREGGLMVRRVTSTDPIVAAFPRPKKVLDWRFADGGLCFVAQKGTRFVGFLWLHERPYAEDEVRAVFVPVPASSAVWDYDAYVEPDFRLGRAFVRLWDAAFEYLRGRDVRWTVSRISAFNAESASAHARMGARKIGSAIFLSFGATQLVVISQPPFVHLSMGSRSGPTVRLAVPLEGGENG
jgi:hypothetical protein